MRSRKHGQSRRGWRNALCPCNASWQRQHHRGLAWLPPLPLAPEASFSVSVNPLPGHPPVPCDFFFFPRNGCCWGRSSETTYLKAEASSLQRRDRLITGTIHCIWLCARQPPYPHKPLPVGFITPVYKQGNQGPESFSRSLKLARLLNGKARVEPGPLCLQTTET